MKKILLKNSENKYYFLEAHKGARYVGEDTLIGEFEEIPSEFVEIHEAWLLEKTNSIRKEKVIMLFSGIRKLWQELSDEFAANNALLGITQEGKTKEVADKFNMVIYYLNCNAPAEAIRELGLIQTDGKYITSEVLSNMSNKLLTFIQENK